MNRFLLHILLLLPFLGWSQVELPKDSSAVEPRSFSEDLQGKYNDEVFKYEATIEGEAKNFISRGITAIVNTISDWFGFEPDPGTYRMVEMIVYGLIIMLTLYFVIRLLMGHSASQIFGKKGQELTAMTFEEKDIEREDLEHALKEALAKSDHRLALRYHYLILLQILSVKELIRWHFQKTNLDYIREIEQADIQKEFATISLVFERIWYGEYPMDEQAYKKASTQFQQLKTRIANVG